MKTHNIDRTWKFWAAGAALTVVVGATGYLLMSPEGDAGSLQGTASGGKGAGKTEAPQSVLVSARRALGGLLGLSPSGFGLGGAPFIVLPPKGPVRGNPLLVAGMNPQNDKGRVAKLDRSQLKNLGRLQQGSQVALPGFDGDTISGEVQLRVEDNGWVRLGGTLPDGKGTFTLNTNFDEVSGSILMPETGRGFEIRTDATGEVLLVERRLSSLVCWPLSIPESVAAAAVADSSTLAISKGGVVPAINTRPGAKGVIYLDFDGQTVTDPSWNGGRPIVAQPSNLTPDQIREVVARVAEDYAPFDIAISTVVADYNAMPPGRRMRVIITPTTTAAPGAGGVAMVGSWSQAGRWMSSTVPAWVFNFSPKAVAEGISHEAGHTLGLNHDGSATSEYYSGHGGGVDVPTSWAPIMGNSYSRARTQWSKAEYKGANNTEDDLAVISSQTNGFGYRADNSAGSSLNFEGNTFRLSGVLRSASAPDVYEFKSAGGRVQAALSPSSSVYANADLQLELRDSADNVLALSNPLDAIGASVSKDGLPAGIYRLMVRAAGTAPRPEGGYTLGYSEYNSVGAYVLSGTVGSPITLPLFTSAASASGILGQPFSYSVLVSSGALLATPLGTLPPGVTYNAATATFSGTPSVTGSWSVTLSASNSSGTASQVVTFLVDEVALSLSQVLGGVSDLATSPAQSPWVGASVIRNDGQSGLVAASGRLANGGNSKLQFTVQGQSVLSFWWKVSSEAGHDQVECRVNGMLVKDAESGVTLAQSGESGWVRQRVRLDAPGTQLVEFTYSKDATLSSGLDRAWVYGVEVGRPPVFKTISKFPRTLTLRPGETTLTLSLVGDGATSYQWKKDGVTLVDGTVGSRVVSGATTSTLKVTGVAGSDSGAYTVEAINASGRTLSRKVEVVVPGLPEITQQIVPPTGLKTGDSMMLSVGASGPQPMFYLWKKNGVNVQWGPSAVYQVRNVKASAAGTYEVFAVNRYGVDQSDKVQVNVAVVAAAPRSR